MSSRSMDMVGDQTKHHYYNERDTNPTLVPLLSPFVNMLNHVTTQAQDTSGQEMIGLIVKATKHVESLSSYLQSNQVCPYGIVTFPRHNKKKGVLESFANCGHRDTTDCINEDQGRTVWKYLHQIQ